MAHSFWVQLNNLNPEKEYAYQFYVDGLLKIGDPYSEKILDPWNDRISGKRISGFNPLS